ncbi:hypothetical protein E2562_025032 [Oryza meyeriana var. granulata]|uniref:Uncharacterized protein n=1 Tax=Oryza meyeriana var. granulata TaxID=110450 RepID=A0A6G1FC64_9ORYZ|nr:hypothetical protein E2562_025032 [Oryza meyeriana var. granulata]
MLRAEPSRVSGAAMFRALQASSKPRFMAPSMPLTPVLAATCVDGEAYGLPPILPARSAAASFSVGPSHHP